MEEAPDGGYGWIIVLSSFVIQMVFVGGLKATRVFLIEFQEYFQENSSKTAWVTSTAAMVALIAGPIASALTRRFGTRVIVIFGGCVATIGTLLCAFADSVDFLIACYGVITGIGFGLTYTPGVAIVGQYFKKHYGVANGLSFTGVGFGILVFPPVFQVLIDNYGFRGAMFIVAGIHSQLIVCGALMRPYKREPNQEPLNGNVSDDDIDNEDQHQREKSVTTNILSILVNKLELRMFLNIQFTLMFIAELFEAFGYFGALVLLPARAVSVGISKLNASLLFTVLGVGSLIGRLSHGFILDSKLIDPAIVYGLAVTLCGLSLLINPFADSYVYLCIVSAITGFARGVYFPTIMVVLKMCVGVECLVNAYGWNTVASGIGTFLGPPILGWSVDTTGTYHVAFITAGCSLIIGGVIVIIGVFVRKRNTNKMEDDQCYDDIKTVEDRGVNTGL